MKLGLIKIMKLGLVKILSSSLVDMLKFGFGDFKVCLIKIPKLKFDQDLCGTCDMNSAQGSFVPFAMFKTLLRAPILNFGLIYHPDCLSRTYDKAFSDILTGDTDWTDEAFLENISLSVCE